MDGPDCCDHFIEELTLWEISIFKFGEDEDIKVKYFKGAPAGKLLYFSNVGIQISSTGELCVRGLD